MLEWRQAIVRPDDLAIDVIKVIDQCGLRIALVVDEYAHLQGIVTDGDVRRALLKFTDLNQPISAIMQTQPQTATEGYAASYYLQLMQQRELYHLPVIDTSGRLVDLHIYSDLFTINAAQTPVVIMAGGLGSRLGKLTQHCPKPLLKVNNQPILHKIIDHLADAGLKDITLSLNYKADMIESYFGDGDKFGVNIQYVKETKRLGTAGSLSLLSTPPENDFVVMNADILTELNFHSLLHFHQSKAASATVCISKYDLNVPYGVMEVENQSITAFEEKPTMSFFVSAGIYVFNPSVLRHVPHNQYFDMPELLNQLVNTKQSLSAFPLREYWIDIGNLKDYQSAQQLFC